MYFTHFVTFASSKKLAEMLLCKFEIKYVVMLCYVMLCYVMLCCVMLRYVNKWPFK